MNYYSLNHGSPAVNFEEAAVKGQAPDKGLYFPEKILSLPKDFITNINNYTKEEIGFIVMKPFVEESIPANVLSEIVSETINFDFPLVKLSDDIFSLELFHGPTLAFKDVGARFMSRCLGYFNRNSNHHTTVLVATSGDTGGAVANGFLGVEGVDVIILYPSGKVSAIQELQLTTCGQNIMAIEVKGNFDDCQAIVKQAFTDIDLNKKFALTSANSINVARWLPQQLYYFLAYNQWPYQQAPVVSVPSGNFGNICAGMMAYASGLPIKHFIAACNTNDVVTRFLSNGNYEPKKAVATISNAMDVGDPSNFVRILELLDHKFDSLKKILSSYSVEDTVTATTINEVYKQYHYILDPHGAVSYYALIEYLKQQRSKEHLDSSENYERGFFLETAHPVKFPDTVELTLNHKIPVPERLSYLLNKQKQSIHLNATFDMFKEWMMTK
jgi:threonine synthase